MAGRVASALAAGVCGLGLGVAGTLGWAHVVAAQPSTPPAAAAPVTPVVQTVATIPDLDARLRTEAAADRFSGVVLVARGDQVLLRQGYGPAERSWAPPLTPDARMRIGSVTKQFTAAAVLKLQEAGRLTTADPVCKHIQPCPEAWAPITLHQLLTHTAGLRDLLAWPEWPRISRETHTLRELTTMAQAQPLLHPPGSAWAYSNTGYQVLGDVVERVSGQAYPDFVRTQLLEPLKLDYTGFVDDREAAPQLAQGYDGPKLLPRWRDGSVITAAGGLVSTADDLLTWTRALNGGQVLKPATLKLMTGREGPFGQVNIHARRGPQLLYAYGIQRGALGQQIEPSLPDEQVFHFGSWNGFRSAVTHLPGSDVTVIVLSNRLDQLNTVRLVTQQGVAAALGRPLPTRLAPATPAPAS